MPTDAQLLQRFVDDRDEQALAELVQRYLGLVYGAALRRTGGRARLAEEVAQQVFVDLAAHAARLRYHPALAGWLHRSTRYAAIDALRAEQRRMKLTQTLAAMPDTSDPVAATLDWEKLRPLLDQALDRLKDEDREVILLRYFKGLSYPEVGERQGLSENAARMRAERALDKLRGHLSRHGVTSTTAALGLLLANQPLVAVPPGLAASVLQQAAATLPVGSSFFSLITMSKLTLPIVSAIVASGLTALVMTRLPATVSAQKLDNLRQQNAALTAAATAAGAAGIRGALATDAVTTVAQAVENRLSHRVAASATASAAALPNAHGHSNHGNATSHDAYLSFAWANDAGDIEAIARLITFDEAGRTKALAVLASMPESIRTQYPTPEQFYAFLFAADALVAPPPGADVLDRFVAVEIAPGQAAMRYPGSAQNGQVYQLTADGWKWLVPMAGVENAPKILQNRTLARLVGP